MIEKIMKAIKNSNKKRSRNITIGTVVGFLLSCTAVMGATSDKYLWIEKDKDGKIKFNTTATSTVEGTWDEENPYKNAGNIWDTVTYTNNTTLSSSVANGKITDEDGDDQDISYGFRLSGDLTGVNFVNNGSIIGIISSSSTSYSYGSGIYNLGIIGAITNTGVISGSNGGRGSGSGIYIPEP